MLMTMLGIALSRQRVYLLAFMSTMLLPMYFLGWRGVEAFEGGSDFHY